METTTIILVIGAFIVGLIIGAAWRYNKLFGRNINAGLPIIISEEHQCNSAAETLSWWLRRRVRMAGFKYSTDWFVAHGFTFREMRDIYPNSGFDYSPTLVSWIKLISELGLEMELRVREKNPYNGGRHTDDMILVHPHIGERFSKSDYERNKDK